jgi:hypothetical protein
VRWGISIPAVGFIAMSASGQGGGGDSLFVDFNMLGGSHFQSLEIEAVPSQLRNSLLHRLSHYSPHSAPDGRLFPVARSLA